MKIFGERIRASRESMNYSQMKFAKVSGIGQSSGIRYEKGKVSPALELLVKIVAYYDVPLDYILRRTHNPQGKLHDCKPQYGYSAYMENFKEALQNKQRELTELALKSSEDDEE